MLAIVWFVLLVVFVAVYAVLDGFDLGAGMLLLFARADERPPVYRAIGPFWDANEVWLLGAGGALFAAFPAAYATIFSAFYLPLVLVVTALILRAVAIEVHDAVAGPSWGRTWDTVFASASATVPVLLGVATGNLIRGIPLDVAGDYTGTPTALLNPFALVVGMSVACALMFHAAAFLALRSGHGATAWCLRPAMSGWLAGLTLLGVAAIIATLTAPRVVEVFVHHPVLGILPAGTFTAWLAAGWRYTRGRYASAFTLSTLALGCAAATCAAALFPYLVAPTAVGWDGITIHEAASSTTTLTIMLIMTAISLPLIIGYTALAYRIFTRTAHRS